MPHSLKNHGESGQQLGFGFFSKCLVPANLHVALCPHFVTEPCALCQDLCDQADAKSVCDTICDAWCTERMRNLFATQFVMHGAQSACTRTITYSRMVDASSHTTCFHMKHLRERRRQLLFPGNSFTGTLSSYGSDFLRDKSKTP